MECDICGKETVDLVGMRVEGSTLMVCSGCRTSGIKPRKAEHTVIKVETSAPAPPIASGEELVLADDYTKRIQRARQKKDLTFEELGKKIFEKESTLRKVESGALRPEDAMVEKLEKALGVSLRASD